MNDIQRGIITLLKSAVMQQPLTLPEDFDIEAAAPLIKHHHMAALAYEGAVQCGIPLQHPVMQSFFQYYCRAVQTSERQMKSLRRVFDAFGKNGIDYMPLKGSRMKALYPKPELRTMGDADVLIRMEQYEKIVPVLESLGFGEQDETDHEIIWRTDALVLELHKRLIPSYNQDFNAYFGDGWNLAQYGSGTQYFMAPEDEFLYLFTHFSKHFRDGGIGCRHVVDLWVYRRENSGLDEAYILNELEKLRLRDFYSNVCQLIASWFDGETENEITQLMTDFVFASGSWGSVEDRVRSSVVRGSGHNTLLFGGKLVYLCQLMFPSAERLRSKYTILKKRPYLLPLVWLVRPFYKVLFEIKTLKSRKQEMSMLSTEELRKRQKLLDYVGLEYHF